jgi:hypothetical protein
MFYPVQLLLCIEREAAGAPLNMTRHEGTAPQKLWFWPDEAFLAGEILNMKRKVGGADMHSSPRA